MDVLIKEVSLRNESVVNIRVHHAKKVSSCNRKKFIACSNGKSSCRVADLKKNIMVPLICTHQVKNSELILTATQNVLCHITSRSFDNHIIETLLELTDVEIKYNNSTFIVIGTE